MIFPAFFQVFLKAPQKKQKKREKNFQNKEKTGPSKTPAVLSQRIPPASRNRV